MADQCLPPQILFCLVETGREEPLSDSCKHIASIKTVFFPTLTTFQHPHSVVGHQFSKGSDLPQKVSDAPNYFTVSPKNSSVTHSHWYECKEAPTSGKLLSTHGHLTEFCKGSLKTKINPFRVQTTTGTHMRDHRYADILG